MIAFSRPLGLMLVVWDGVLACASSSAQSISIRMRNPHAKRPVDTPAMPKLRSDCVWCREGAIRVRDAVAGGPPPSPSQRLPTETDEAHASDADATATSVAATARSLMVEGERVQECFRVGDTADDTARDAVGKWFGGVVASVVQGGCLILLDDGDVAERTSDAIKGLVGMGKFVKLEDARGLVAGTWHRRTGPSHPRASRWEGRTDRLGYFWATA